MKKQPALILLTLLVFITMFSNSYAESLAVSFSGAEMRSKPTAMNSKIVVKLDRYSPLTVIEQGQEYYKVRDYKGNNGWVHRSLVSNIQGVVVIGERVNVRQGPGTEHPVSFQLAKGITAKLLEKQDKWLLVQTTDLKQGWIADFLVWGE